MHASKIEHALILTQSIAIFSISYACVIFDEIIRSEKIAMHPIWMYPYRNSFKTFIQLAAT